MSSGVRRARNRSVGRGLGIPLLVVALLVAVLAVAPPPVGAPAAAAQGPTGVRYEDVVLDDEPLAFWRFEEGTGSVVSDLVGAIDGTAVGSTWSGESGVLGSDASMQFDGSNDHVSLGAPPELMLDQFSFESWFRFDEGQEFRWDGNPKIVRSRTFGWSIQRNPDGTVTFGGHAPGCNDSRSVTSDAALDDEGWHQVVATMAPDATRLYIDGELAGEDEGTPSVCYGSGNVGFGRDANHNSDYLRGWLDEISWYGYPLTGDQVAEHFCAATGSCGDGEVTADAGEDQSVVEGDLVTLDGSGSTGTAVTPGDPPDVLEVPGMLRDFRLDHPDFQGPGGNDRGIVEEVLGPDGKPVYAHPGGSTPTTSGQENFDQWYRDTPGVNIPFEHTITMEKISDDPVLYQFGDSSFFPIDDQGWGNEGRSHNYWFTYEIHQEFTYQGGETLTFRGDDDLWVFLNDRRVIDLGGIHSAQTATVQLDDIAADIGIEVGGTYPFDLFFAERQTSQSNFFLTTSLLLESPEPLTYRWDLVEQGGPPITLSNPTAANPSFRPLDDGVYEFELTVTQGPVSSTDRVIVTAANADPAANTDLAYSVETGVAMVAGTYTDRGIVDTHTATVDWGDGTPPVTVPVLAQGTGWGEIQAAHVYAANGTYTATVTIGDDDGGVSETQTIDVTVEDAAVTIPQLGVALWADSQTINQTLQISGSHQEIVGLVHSNRDLKVSGSSKTFTGGTEYVHTLQVSGSDQVFTPAPVQVAAAPAPASFPLADYQPGGRAAVAAGSAFHDMSASCGSAWHPSALLEPGLYWAPCDVQVSGSQFAAGPVTIAAAGKIHVSGSTQDLFAPYVDGVLFTSGDTSDRAIQISGSHSNFVGYAYASAGGIQVTGSHHTMSCGLIGSVIKIAGSHNRIDVDSCPAAQTEIIETTVPAVPLAVPTLDLSLVSDRPEVLPGESIDYTSTASNDSTTLIVPGVLAAQNLTASPISMAGAQFSLDYFDVATDAWVTLASTSDGSARLATEPTASAGVTYPPAGPDRVAGTTIDSVAWAIWASAGIVELSPDDLALLQDPARVSSVRAQVTLAPEPATAAVREIIGFGDNLVEDIRAASGDLTDGQITLTRPGAPPVFHTPTDTPELALLSPGGSVTVETSATAPMPAIKDPAETDADYLARLASIDGASLAATAFSTADATVGTIAAPQQVAVSSLGLPVVDLEVLGPETIDAGGTAVWTLTLTNTGSRPAVGYSATLMVDGAPVTLAGVTPSLAPGESATLTGEVPVPTGRVNAIVGEASLSWTDAAGNDYGPLIQETYTGVVPPPGLVVRKTTDRPPEIDPHETLYQVTVRNSGGTPITGIQLVDTPDAAVGIVPGSVTTTVGAVLDGNDPGDTTITVDVGTLEGGQLAIVEYYVSSEDTPRGETTMTNQATVTSAELEPVLSDDPTRPGVADPTVRPIPGVSGGPGDPEPNTGPEIGECSPADGEAITAPTALSCVITPRPDTVVEEWEVVIRRPDGEGERTITGGTGTPPNPLAVIDPTILENGTWIVEVVVTDDDDGESKLQIGVVVEGQLKLGRYHITYQDLAVPVGGIPIQVLRTYDTLDRDISGDFGHGWSLDVADFRVDVHRPLGEGGWEQYQCGGGFIFVQYCFRTTRAHYVTVTWPDGRVETFDFTPEGLSSFWSAGAIASYTGRPSATSTLRPVAGDTNLGWAGTGDLLDDFFGAGDPYDPQRFVLVAKDGTEYTLDRDQGLIEARDRNDNTVTVTDDGIVSSNGPSIDFERDAEGRIETITGPDGEPISYDYSPEGDLESVTDQNEHTTGFEYEDHALTRIVDALGHPFQRLEYEDGRLVAVIDANDNRTEIEPDVGARTERVTSPDGRMITLSTFDERGNVVSRQVTTDGTAVTSTFRYTDDGRDLLLERIGADGRSALMTYTDAGDLETYVDPENATYEFDYHPSGLPAAVRDSTGGALEFEYDARGNLVRFEDAAGRSRTFSHDARGNTLDIRDDRGVRRSFTYTPEGWVEETIGPEGTTTVTYDAVGRAIRETLPGGAINYTYDNVGQLTQAAGVAGGITAAISIQRDDVGQVLQIDAGPQHVAYTYDAGGRRASMTTRAGTVNYTYDQMNRLTGVSDARGTVEYDYGANGIARISRPNGVVTEYTHDAAGRLDRIEHRGPAGLLDFFDYELDGNGNVTAVESLAGMESYELDELDRLTEVRYPDGSAESFTYNAAGDRLTRTVAGETTHYSYGVDGRLESYTSSEGTTNLEYDGNGNVIDDGTYTYTYNDRNQMVEASGPSGVHTFSYDVFGNRVVAEGEPQGWDRLSGLPTITEDGPTDVLQGPGGVLSETNAGETTWPVTDGLGSVRGITDASGALVGSVSYEAFGSVKSAEGMTSGFGFTGQQTDETGLLHLRSRQYDPDLGRFLSRDSLASYNEYSYVNNNPSTMIDPTGATSLLGYAAIGAATSGLVYVGRAELCGQEVDAGGLFFAMMFGAAAGALASVAPFLAMVAVSGYGSYVTYDSTGSAGLAAGVFLLGMWASVLVFAAAPAFAAYGAAVAMGFSVGVGVSNGKGVLINALTGEDLVCGSVNS